MFLTEYNEAKVMEKERQEGVNQERERVATDLLKEGGLTVSFIARISKLPEDTVRKLAKSMGVTVL